MYYAPIALFVYNRPWHAQQTIEALQNNFLASESELFIFSDAPKERESEDKVKKVRDYIKTTKGFKKVTIIERHHNLGLSQSIIAGVTEIINRYGKVIVLEDDLVTSPYFLKFMNEALFLYENEEKAISICGYMYPINIKDKAETVFLRTIDSWGWATWKRGWDLFDPDGKKLLESIKARKLLKQFDLGGWWCGFSRMLKEQISGLNDSWAIRWYACVFLNNKLSLYPRQSLVKNIGFDCSGLHCGTIDAFRVEVVKEPVRVKRIQIAEDQATIKKIRLFFLLQKLNILKHFGNKIIGFLQGKRT